jgi:hypothetical protein
MTGKKGQVKKYFQSSAFFGGELCYFMTRKKGLWTLEGCFLEKNGTKLAYFERNKG